MYSRAWYGDEKLALTFPEGWNVRTLAPETPLRYRKQELELHLVNPLERRALLKWQGVGRARQLSLMI
jgi:hypothetical protein